MARSRQAPEIRLSVLDRLLDDEPEVPDRQRPFAEQLRRYQEAVQRDLEDLLNSHPRASGWPARLRYLEDSLVNYGLPDFLGLNLASEAGREAFRRSLEDTIRRWEPRLDQVRVTLRDRSEPLERRLSFQIEGVLRVEEMAETIVFRSLLEPLSGSFSLERGDDDG